ncbi:MAG: sulfotransferase [Magnetococcales bacterium]|nr:sulfotransferase [Magnetococcales bacterium]
MSKLSRQHKKKWIPRRGTQEFGSESALAHELNKAQVYQRNGMLNEAIGLYEQILATFPENSVVLGRLSQVLLQQGKSDQALLLMKKALLIDPANKKVEDRISEIEGAKLQKKNMLADLRRTVAQNPSDLEKLFELGKFLLNGDKVDEAIVRFRKLLTVKPGHFEAMACLGRGYILKRDLIKAADQFRQVLAINGEHFEALIWLATLGELNNELEQAESYIKRALAIEPNHLKARHLHAVLLRRRGKMTEALESLEPLADCSHGSDGEQVHFELGKLHDRQGNYEKAMHHYILGNNLQTKGSLYKHIDKNRYLTGVEQALTDLASKSVQWSVADPKVLTGEVPAFLLGFPRSGTTLLDQILDSHPAVQVMEEKEVMSDTMAAITHQTTYGVGGREALNNSVSAIQGMDISAGRELYFMKVDHLFSRLPKRMLIDKHPLNTVNISAISYLFPEAKIIFALRHPCDVILSSFMQNFVPNHAMANFTTIKDAVHLYCRVMTLWQKSVESLPLNVHVVRYESLVEDLEGEAKKLLGFLGLEWYEGVLDFHLHARSKKKKTVTPSYQQVVEPIYVRSKYRWLNYRKWFEPHFSELEPFVVGFGYDSLLQINKD